jgi:hypothetical protein
MYKQYLPHNSIRRCKSTERVLIVENLEKEKPRKQRGEKCYVPREGGVKIEDPVKY